MCRAFCISGSDGRVHAGDWSLDFALFALSPLMVSNIMAHIRLRELSTQQLPSHDIEVGEGAGDEEPMGILLQASVADLDEAELPFDHAEQVFDTSPDSGFGAVAFAICFTEWMAGVALVMGKVLGVRRVLQDGLRLPSIGAVAPYPGFLPMQQIGQRLGVMGIGRGGEHRVNQFGMAVYPDMGLHAEVPLVAFLGLAHLGVTAFRLVLGRGRSGDDRGIHNGASADLQPLEL